MGPERKREREILRPLRKEKETLVCMETGAETITEKVGSQQVCCAPVGDCNEAYFQYLLACSVLLLSLKRDLFQKVRKPLV